MLGFGLNKTVTANVTPSTIVYFDKLTPTTVGVVFDPDTPATTDILYVSSVDASTWIYNGVAYQTYVAPTVVSTEFVLNGTTIDAGGNKTSSISRNGTVFIKNATTGVFSAIWDNQFNCVGLSGEQTSLRSRMLLFTSNEGFLISGATFSNSANGFHRFERKRGTVYSPTNTLSGDILGSIQSNGGWSGGTDIEFRATEEHSSLTNSGAEIVFKTKTNATVGTTPTDRVKIKNNGKFSIEGETASTLACFNASKEVESLSTSTYPSLTELSYVKGITSAVQTQIDTKAPINARVQTVTSSATVTPVSTNDLVIITAQAVGLTLANPTGTFTEGQALMIRIKDNGTARTIAFDTNYRAIGVTLPTTTVISKTMYLGIIYNSTDSKWDIVGYNLQA